jgi:hypothetical protein
MPSPELPSLVASVLRRIRELQSVADPPDAHSLEFPPLTEDALVAAESQLGFAVAPALRALYEQVGNGGFGPGYGLLGLVGGAVQEDELDALGVLRRYQEPDPRDPRWRWPERLLPVVHMGCAMFLCVDGADERGMVVWFEPNPHEDGAPWEDAFIILGVSFQELMERWAAGDDWSLLMENAWNRQQPDADD